MLNRIKDKIRGNNTLYFFARGFWRWRDKDFRDWIRAYAGPDVMWVKHPGQFYPEEYIGSIGVGESGFFWEMTEVLSCLCYTERFHLTPVIDWSSYTFYSERKPVNGTRNVWEYYFKPVSEIPYDEVENCKNVINVSDDKGAIALLGGDSLKYWTYDGRLAMVDKLGLLYKKYIVLNQTTLYFIERNLKEKLGEKKTLGVHVRGTDFKRELKNHPCVISPNNYIVPAKELMKKYGYEQIFLATDSLEAVELFRNEFGSMLVYYEDVLRSDGDVGVHCLENERENHHYLLGLEVLRDAYTLAACDSLLAGMSNVSLAAQYIKLSEGEEFKEVEILDHGINHNNRQFGKKYKGKG